MSARVSRALTLVLRIGAALRAIVAIARARSRDIALCGCAFALTPALARAKERESLPVQVVDIAGGRAFLSVGSAQGLRVGTRVTFARVERRVEQTSSSYAVVSARRLRVGSRGVAHGVQRSSALVERATPRPLDAFRDQWPEAVLPASQQHPKPIRLGRMQARSSAVAATLAASGAALLPLDGESDPVGRAELRARVDAAPVAGFPLRVRGDVALQDWFGRYTTGTARGDPRPLLRVRELSLALGEVGGYRAELGRLRYAASNLGPLDGARFEAARLGPLTLAGFGGLLPDPIDGQFARGAGRFGVELALRALEQPLRPELTAVVQGSVFDGRMDERRLYARAQLWPGDHRLSGYAEAALFDENNPWRRPAVDLNAAGAELDLRFSALHLGGRFDLRKPERSYWLASSFPQSWLCSGATAQSAVGCLGSDDTRYVAQGYGGFDLEFVQLDMGAAWAGSSDAELGHHTLGHATMRFSRVRGRYDLALGGSHEGGSLLAASSAARADFGVALFDERVRLNLYYRPAHRRYRASVRGLWEQGAGASLHVEPMQALAFDLFGDVRIGDVDVMMLMLTMLYRIGS